MSLLESVTCIDSLWGTGMKRQDILRPSRQRPNRFAMWLRLGPLSVFFATLINSSAIASNAVDPGSTGWTFYVVNLIIAATAIIFAIGVTGLMIHRGLSYRRTLSRLRGRLSAAEGKLYWSQSILAVEPQIVLVWDGSDDAPQPLLDSEDDLEHDFPLAAEAQAEDPEDAEGLEPQDLEHMGLIAGKVERPFSPLGKPQILGSSKALGSVLGIAGPIEPGTKGGRNGALSIFDLFLTGLTRQDKSRLVAAIQDLKVEGTSFSISIESPDRHAFVAEGRPAGGKAVVWLRDVSDEGQQIRDLSQDLNLAIETRESFMGLLNVAPFPIWQRDRSMAITWANRAFVRAVEEDHLQDVVVKGAELDHTGKQLARSAVEALDTLSERRYVVIDGQRRSLDFLEIPLKEGTMGIALDVTRLDEVENVLQRHIDAHGETLNTLASAVAIYGPDKKLIFYNRAYVVLMGLKEQWLETGPLESEVLERLRDARRLPEQADFPAWKRGRLDLYVNLIDQQDELWHLPDGSTLRVIVQPHPFGGLIYLYEDVTDLVTLESNYNQLINVQTETLDNLSEGVAVFGTDGRLKLHNAAFEKIWKISAANLKGEPHFDTIVKACNDLVDDTDSWSPLRKRITSGDAERKSLGAQMDRNDGTIISYGAVPLPDGATLTSFLDITDTIQIERALRERNEALETADRIKSEFVNHVSYQLRTPLNSIIGFTDMMDHQLIGELNPKQKEYTGNILEASGELLNLINDILDLATIDAGGMVLEVEEVDLRDVLEAALRLSQKKALDGQLTLKLECADGIGPILADERRLKQILFNLTANAASFTPAGGTITLGASRAGHQVSIWVSDTGSGIETKYQPTVFDRFENRGGEGKRGAGLGLSLVKSFVELHGGWMSLQSEPGKGTTVTCHLVDRAQASAAE